MRNISFYRASALVLAVAFALIPFTGGVTAGSTDDISVQCHSAKIRVYTWANKYDLTPGETFTQYVNVYVSYQVDPVYLAGYMRDSVSGEWSGPSWQHAARNRCYYATYAFTVEAPEEPGAHQVWAFGKGGGYPSPGAHVWSHAFNINVRAPELAVEHVVPDAVDVGSAFSARVTVANTGTDTAFDVTVAETLGSGLEVVDGGHAVDGNGVSWNAGDLAPGDRATFTVTLRATERAGATLTATATGTTRGGGAVDAPAVSTDLAVRAPVIAFAHDMPAEVASGEMFEVTVTYRNVGDLEARALTLRDAFDSDYTPVPVDVRVTNAGDPTVLSPRMPAIEYVYGAPAANERADPVHVKGDDVTLFTWDVPALAPGEALTVKYHLVAPVRHTVPDAPEAPALPDVEDEPVVPDVEGEPAVPEAPELEPNAGEYAFVADAAFSTPAGFPLADAGEPDAQRVRDVQQEEAPPAPELPL